MKKGMLFTILVVVVLAACAPRPREESTPRPSVSSWYTSHGLRRWDKPFAVKRLAAVRPLWEGQIMSPAELKPNTFLWESHEVGDYLVLIYSAAYYKNGDCRYDYVYWREDWPVGQFIMSGYCSDAGLIPYEHGWNPSNHMMPSNTKPLTDEQFKALALFLRPAP